MAELWKIRARKPAAIGMGVGIVRGFVYYNGGNINRNDLSISIQIGDYRLTMLQSEYEEMQRSVAKTLKSFEE